MNSTNIATCTADNAQLESAFLQFNELSEKLTESYRDLEHQVATLSGELAVARNERLKQLTEKEILAGKLEGLLAALPGGVIVLDDDDLITQVNPVAHDLLGMHIVGRHWKSLVDDVFMPGRDQLRLRDGRWLSLSVRSLGAEQGRIILLTDVTETHELQEKLNRKQRLASLGEMIASLAHQLRTPLGAAMLTISSLNHPNIQKKDIKRISARSLERLNHLERMVNDMLIFARGEHAELDTIAVDDLAKQLQGNLFEQYAAAGFEIQIDNRVNAGISLQANTDALLSAFQNLADNALDALADKQQHCGHDWHGKLSIEIDIDDDHMIIFSFKDNGNGIEASVQERVLEPFYTTRTSGTGLGLAVVNASLESFQGKLVISSMPGDGSCFRALLPVSGRQQLLPGGYLNSNNRHDLKKRGEL